MTALSIDVQAPLTYAEEQEGLRLPHGVMPGAFLGEKNPEYENSINAPEYLPSGIDSVFDEARWNAYKWDIPVGFDTVDPEASPKPSWADIVRLDSLCKSHYPRQTKLSLLYAECTRRIAVNYHPKAADNRNKEWQVRLSGEDMTEKDAERERLRARYQVLKTRVGSMTVTQLKAFDPADDSLWVDSGGASS